MNSMDQKEKRLDRVEGCLVGGACGDALGYEIEFMDEPSIFSRFGKAGIQDFELDRRTGKALISDDTQMTMFTAEGLILGREKWKKSRKDNTAEESCMKTLLNAVLQSYEDWLITQETSFRAWGKEVYSYHNPDSELMKEPELFVPRAPGNTCLSALDYRRDHPWKEDTFLHSPINRSKGCGGIMRTAPAALLYWPEASIDEIEKLSAELAAITHTHPLGWLPSALLGRILYRILLEDSDPLREIIRQENEVIERKYAHLHQTRTLTSLIRKAIELSETEKPDLECIHELGEGWVAEETLAIAVYCALRHEDDFSKAITASVNHRGDSDSTGAVCGNLLGAWIGYQNIPEKWKRNLQFAGLLRRLARELNGA